MRAQGEIIPALAAYESSLAIARGRLTEAPEDRRHMHDVSVVLDKIGDLELQRGEVGRAKQHFEQSLEIANVLARNATGDASLAFELSLGIGKLADIALRQGEDENAMARYRQALEEIDRANKIEPQNARWQRSRSALLIQMGDAASRAGDRGNSRNLVFRSRRCQAKTCRAGSQRSLPCRRSRPGHRGA